jgi:hypothetical protein
VCSSDLTVYYRTYSGYDEEVWSQNEAHKTTLMVKLDGDAPSTLMGKSIEAIANVTIHQADDPLLNQGGQGIDW